MKATAIFHHINVLIIGGIRELKKPRKYLFFVNFVVSFKSRNYESNDYFSPYICTDCSTEFTNLGIHKKKTKKNNNNNNFLKLRILVAKNLYVFTVKQKGHNR